MYKKLRALVFAVSVLSLSTVARHASGQLAAASQLSSSASPQQKLPVRDAAQMEAAASVTPVTGTFVTNFTIKLVTPVPSGSAVLCVLLASTTEHNSSTLNYQIEERGSGKATISGTTASCTASIPYSWTLQLPGVDNVNLSYQLYIVNPTGTNQAAETRFSQQFVVVGGYISGVPSGTTTYNLSATL
ncbi:hypothetical protein HDF16_005580 [Granulicella aggregans]|uniref:Secreted protein n=1 Tax=Granulicella aggregans TaxID=474949 RepID=A0A7W8E6Y7_9BACT|nr:hypothetical protein [Granulicella aggregans]MBB5060844.1 hypothetical protein [Granulicella aggregans]